VGTEARIETDALGTVSAILRAAARFDRKQRRDLHLVGIELLPVDPMRGVKQVVERQLEKIGDLCRGPVRTRLRRDADPTNAHFFADC
jgi:hypothetical protein